MVNALPDLRRGPSGPFDEPAPPPVVEGLSNVFFVDGGTLVDPADQDGSAVAPYETMAQAIAAVLALASESGVILVCPGDYSSESLTFDPAGVAELTIAGWTGAVNGGFGDAGSLIGDIDLAGAATRLHLQDIQTLDVLCSVASGHRIIARSAVIGSITSALALESIEAFDSSIGDVTIEGDLGLLRGESSDFTEVSAESITADGLFSDCTFTIGLTIVGGTGISALVYSNTDAGAIDTDSDILSLVANFGDIASIDAVDIEVLELSVMTCGTIIASGVLGVVRLTNCSSIGAITTDQINDLQASFCTFSDITVNGNVGSFVSSETSIATLTVTGNFTTLVVNDGSIVTLDVDGTLTTFNAMNIALTTATVATLTTSLLRAAALGATMNFGTGAGTLTVRGGTATNSTFSVLTLRMYDVEFVTQAIFSGVTNLFLDAASEKSAQKTAINYGATLTIIDTLDADVSRATRINNANGTIVPASFARYVKSAGAFTNNRTWSIDATASVVGQRFSVERWDNSAFTLAIAALYTFPSGGPPARAWFHCTVAGTTFVFDSVELMN